MVMPKLDLETRIVEMELGNRRSAEALGQQSSYTCPECSGPIFTIQEGKLRRFRCQVGHAYSIQTLLRGKYDYMETLTAQMINAFEEIVTMTAEFARDARKNGFRDAARYFEMESRRARGQAAAMRSFFKEGGAAPPD
jgi:two-component system chemotaxis response regulator CheB